MLRGRDAEPDPPRAMMERRDVGIVLGEILDRVQGLRVCGTVADQQDMHVLECAGSQQRGERLMPQVGSVVVDGHDDREREVCLARGLRHIAANVVELVSESQLLDRAAARARSSRSVARLLCDVDTGLGEPLGELVEPELRVRLGLPPGSQSEIAAGAFHVVMALIRRAGFQLLDHRCRLVRQSRQVVCNVCRRIVVRGGHREQDVVPIGIRAGRLPGDHLDTADRLHRQLSTEHVIVVIRDGEHPGCLSGIGYADGAQHLPQDVCGVVLREDLAHAVVLCTTQVSALQGFQHRRDIQRGVRHVCLGIEGVDALVVCGEHEGA